MVRQRSARPVSFPARWLTSEVATVPLQVRISEGCSLVDCFNTVPSPCTAMTCPSMLYNTSTEPTAALLLRTYRRAGIRSGRSTDNLSANAMAAENP